MVTASAVPDCLFPDNPFTKKLITNMYSKHFNFYLLFSLRLHTPMHKLNINSPDMPKYQFALIQYPKQISHTIIQ